MPRRAVGERRVIAAPPAQCACGKFCKANEIMCRTCRRDPAKRATAAFLRQAQRAEARRALAEEAERLSVARLPKRDSYIPIQGEAAVLKMLRGEW